LSRAAQGLRAWLLQRFTAVYIALYLVVSVFTLLTTETIDYPLWRSWFSAPLPGVASVLFAVMVLLHVWVGVRDVLIDYVHVIWLRLFLLALAALMMFSSLLLIMRALIGILPGVTGL